ncbi:hypothetical protein EV401DRAFT_2038561, partial [Pisolithus croceorrhizus]
AAGSVAVTLSPLPSPSSLASTRTQIVRSVCFAVQRHVHSDVIKYTWGGCLIFFSLSAWIANTWQVQIMHYGRVIDYPSYHSWLAALRLLETRGSPRYGAKERVPHSATLLCLLKSAFPKPSRCSARIEIRRWHSKHQWTRCQTPNLTRWRGCFTYLNIQGLRLSTENRLFNTGLGGQLRSVSCSEQYGASALIRLFAL